jgi:hypothetical protein
MGNEITARLMPVQSMREIQSLQHLYDILGAAYEVVNLRDMIYERFFGINAAGKEIETIEYMQKNMFRDRSINMFGYKNKSKIGHERRVEYLRKTGFYKYYVLMCLPLLPFCFLYITGFLVFLISEVICISACIYSIRKYKENVKKFKAETEAMKAELEQEKVQFENQARALQNVFWCAEVIPSEYRNVKAINIMRNAIHSSRADNWKECCDMYDKACLAQEMREYQEEQLRLLHEVATNAQVAATMAGISATANILRLF